MPESDVVDGLTFVERTGQRWKLRAVFWLPGLMMLLTYWLAKVSATSSLKFLFIVGGDAGGLAFFVWSIASFRCPACGDRVLFRAMREQSIREWETWLLALSACPVCGDPGGTE